MPEAVTLRKQEETGGRVAGTISHVLILFWSPTAHLQLDMPHDDLTVNMSKADLIFYLSFVVL